MTTNNFKPILFSTEMVQAILAGRKTQTRRVVKEKMTTAVLDYAMENNKPTDEFIERNCNLKKGDILWVRETFAKVPQTAFGENFIYKSTFDRTFSGPWKPSLFMPKEAARIFMKVTNVRVQRLQDINAAHSGAEGIVEVKFEYHKSINPRVVEMTAQIMAFRDLWDSINAKKHPWESNPWVWVYEFERIEKPENFLP